MSAPAAPQARAQGSRRLRRRAEIRFGPDEPTCLGYSRNISKTGLMIGAVRVFSPGTLLKLRITFMGVTVDLRGRVIWAREGPVQWLPTGRIGMGVRFIDPPNDLLARIDPSAGS